jgi:4-diphosphocytidyl-2-C-methyl-D-erythritol kinase
MSPWSEWPAPAKLNLFLHITGRRDDGYHLLQTLFQILDWGDTVRLRMRDDGAIVRMDALTGVAPDADLCVRAARALQHRLGPAFGADIALVKRIPLGGGLGGGSSDAAAVLVGLNTLWRGGLDDQELARIGLSLGADVPVFVRGRSAWAEGVGETLTPVALPESWYVLVDPKVSVSTGPLFQAAQLTRNSPPTTISRFLSGVLSANAFEPVVRARYPRVVQALDWLGRFGPARLSGSGGCGFVAVASAHEASNIAAQCPEGFAAYAVRGVNTSPLHERRMKFMQG